MKTVLVLTTTIAIILIGIILKLLLKIQLLTKKIKYVDEANMWHKLAITDDLTGVYNRNAYNLYIDRNRIDKKQKSRGIILFDVDNFKTINDTQGHLVGDIVLKKVAKILTEVFSAPEYRVFRIGGDEFSVLVEGVSEMGIIERLLTLKKRLEEDGDISLSKGYSMIKDNPEEAFKYADEMLYGDKRSKKLRSALSETL